MLCRGMLVWMLFALFVTIGVTLLLVGVLRRVNPPPPRNDGENAV
jgi:hypothetical protein